MKLIIQTILILISANAYAVLGTYVVKEGDSCKDFVGEVKYDPVAKLIIGCADGTTWRATGGGKQYVLLDQSVNSCPAPDTLLFSSTKSTNTSWSTTNTAWYAGASCPVAGMNQHFSASPTGKSKIVKVTATSSSQGISWVPPYGGTIISRKPGGIHCYFRYPDGKIAGVRAYPSAAYCHSYYLYSGVYISATSYDTFYFTYEYNQDQVECKMTNYYTGLQTRYDLACKKP